MLNTSNIMFYSTLMLGTTMVISSKTWLGMWLGMEMNLIAFIAIMHKSKSPPSSESCMIYFLIQSLGSILMLISIMSNSLIITAPVMVKELFSEMLMISMLIKLGAPPFHFWFPEMMEKITWMNCMVLMTWQKIAPLTVISHMSDKFILLPVIITMSVIVGAMLGLNQTSIRKIMGYSSISHMGWMLACMKFNNEMWIKYLIIYSAIIIMMTSFFNYKSSMFINQFCTSSPTITEKLLMITLFMSLGGLPPFLGFMPKWMVIQSMIVSNSYNIAFMMIMMTLITLFFYLRMISSNLLINSISMKWNKSKNMSINMTISMIMINLALPVLSTFSF